MIPDLKQIPGIEKSIVVPPTARAPKNGEQTVAIRQDGSLLFLWSEFINLNELDPSELPPESPLRRNPNSDDGYARICGKISVDGGRTWSEPRVVVDDRDALVNCICPCLTRMADGRLLLAYSWRSGGNGADNYGNCAKMVRFSDDDGESWSDRVQITPETTDYHTGCHDRAWTLDNGRVLVHCHTIFPPGVAQPGPGFRRTCMGTYYAYSDDHGRTWKRTEVIKDPIAGFGGRFEEACLVQRGDGSLIQFIRCWRGQSYRSESTDHGATWSAPVPSGVFSALAPSYVTRLPDSDDLLMLWNPTWNPDEPICGRRTMLAAAVSKDGGYTWGFPKALETSTELWSEYPGVTFHQGEALVYYRVFNRDRKQCQMVQVRTPIEWFYDEA